ncbi:MAG: hypothetical protein IKZ94_08515 [Lachnospiraceae bacterium]|nr:hypothetical protein [Lachnospiraceae bacterium]
MDVLTLQDIVLSSTQVIVAIPIIVLSGRLMAKKEYGLLPAYFTFAMVSYLLGDVYYVAYNILRPNTRMPMAATEIAECAMLLLLSAGIETISDIRAKINWPALFFAIAFTGANIALWAAWSGDIPMSVIFGLPYVYYMYLILVGLYNSGAAELNKIAVCIVVMCLVVSLSIAALGADEYHYMILTNICYVFDYLILIWVFVRYIRMMLNKDPLCKSRALYLSYTFHIGTLFVMFMSEGFMYSVATAVSILSLPMMFFAMKKELSKDDIQ